MGVDYLSIEQLLADKGIQVRKEHLEELDKRWSGMQKLRGDLKGIKIDDADIGLRSIPGGDHVG